MVGFVRGIARLFDARRRAKASRKLLSEMEIGHGTRIRVGHLDGMFPHLIRCGKNCVFAPGAMVLTHDASYYLFTGEYRVSPVVIGDNVFVGYGAIIMPGVTIGNDVVIGAGSVVTRDVPSERVVAGVPARVMASIAEYKDRRPVSEMFVPPYEGKLPCEVTDADVLSFRRRVYARLREAREG